MVKMQIAGIQISVPEGEVSLYKRAGYSVVEETPAPVVETETPTVEETPAPAKKKTAKE